MSLSLSDFQTLIKDLRDRINETVMGQDELVTLLLTALFARGHALIEGPPGTAKTLLAQTLANSASLDYGRIQFTPDLMPGDVLGINIYNFETSTFTLTRGPVFTNVLLADEINRAPPKTQSALLQAMNERSVTIDGTTYPLGESFFVIATQNPVEQHGTYPLPEAQLDRFMFKLLMDFPDADTEFRILAAEAGKPLLFALSDETRPPIFGAEDLTNAHALIDTIRIEDSILNYIVQLVRATREDTDILFGASTRAASALAAAVRAYAAIDGRNYAIPNDVQTLFPHAMRHRIILGPAAEIEGRSADDVLGAIIARQDAPR